MHQFLKFPSTNIAQHSNEVKCSGPSEDSSPVLRTTPDTPKYVCLAPARLSQYRNRNCDKTEYVCLALARLSQNTHGLPNNE
eukprot:7714424-Pyramimonas_sp.AAC.1